MYGIEWLVGGSPVQRGNISGLQEDAIAEGSRRVVMANNDEPIKSATRFRLLDSGGEVVGVFSVDANSGRHDAVILRATPNL